MDPNFNHNVENNPNPEDVDPDNSDGEWVPMDSDSDSDNENDNAHALGTAANPIVLDPEPEDKSGGDNTTHKIPYPPRPPPYHGGDSP